ncbi:beta-N-acetylglucosaminidase domain-containing protein [Kribbella shirazensis]|uniref:Hyaluronoglucosaminidase n=1 Tax=Kribbella shirazensis TaxID=1105143 RepID=A0A7X5VC95_9ACTN|nr:beta-N-acetylglucosaminidase domain-containing protein [Kribbella shirazensis]NIK58575.1 hyaluronoglucosaminidase [Kribbella shirazensis]
MRLLRSAVCVLALVVPFVSVPLEAGAVPPTAAKVFPEPQQLVQRDDGFPIPLVVGLVRTARTDADAERVVRQALTDAGVQTVRTSDGRDPRTPMTIWLGRDASILSALKVPDSTGLAAEGYVLAAGRDRDDRGHVVLDGVDSDGTYYAAQSLAQLIQSRPGQDWIPGVAIRDWPTMRYRGSIEGFYGTPWSHADRLDHLGYLGDHWMNTYEYAPKDDPYHRERWRDPYPADKLAQLAELVNRARQNKVDFTFALSPGLSICYTSDADFQALIAKFQALYDVGGRAFNVPLDDIDYNTWHCDADRAKYGTGGGAAGRAQSDLLTRVQREWVETKPDVAPLQMVPTEYYNVSETPYKKALREQLDADVVVHWTGIGVVPRTITAAQAAQAKAVFGHDILIWDNYPVNDYAAGRLLLAPYSGREPAISDNVAGVISNPMNQAAVSKIALYSFAELGWNPAKYDVETSWQRALAERAGGNAATTAALRVFADLNTYDGTLHPDSAPVFAAAVEQFWQLWRSGQRAQAIAVLRPQVGAIAAAPATIRAGVVDPAFTAEAESWLKATELWGQAMQRALDLLAALDAGDGAAAWTARQQVSGLVTQAKAIRDSRQPHSGTYPRIGEGVVDELIAETGRVHDRWLGVQPGRTATTNLGTYQDNVPARMIDGDLNTFYWSNGAPRTGSEIRVDLGAPATIGAIAVLMGKASSPNDYIHSGALEYSLDGTRWTELTRATTAEVRATAPAGTTARYVRYRSLSSSDFWLVVREFSVETIGGRKTTLTAGGAPAPAPGSSYQRAVDGNLETAYVPATAPKTGDALTATLSAPRELAGLTILQQSSSVGSAHVEVQVGGVWQRVGAVSSAYAEVPVDDLAVEAVRLAWTSGTPAVAEIVPLWSDTPLAELVVAEDRADVVRGEASTFTVDIAAQRGEDVSGTLGVAAPAGWTVDPASTSVAVKRGFTQSVSVKLTPPAGAALADVDLPVTFTTGATTFEAVLRVAVRPRTGDTNVALRRPVVASSIEPGTSFTADLAVDGNAGTRWASGYDNASWLQVDLGTSTRLGKLVLRWETAYGSAYEIQVSDDANTWTTATEVSNGDGGTDTLWLDATARYVRMQGVQRATQYGYSLYELEAYPAV